MTSKKTIFAISLIWVYTFSISYLPPILGYHHWVPSAQCYLANVFMNSVILFQSISVLLTTLIIYVMYAAMFRIAAKHMQQIVSATVGNSAQKAAKIQMHLKAAKTLLLVTGIFSICWIPYGLNLINIIYTDKHNPNSIQRQVQQYLAILLFLNSAVNPIIYVRRMPGFKSEFIRILTCNRCKGSGSVAPLN